MSHGFMEKYTGRFLPNTGEITLKPKDEDRRKRDLAELLRMIKESPVSEDFIPPRDDAWGPDPFADWVEPLAEQGGKL